MSIVKIRAALETHLAAITPAIDTAWENVAFTPTAGVPYQNVALLLAPPDNPTYGDGFHREHGYMQVMLCYPIQAGTADAAARAELIRDAFPRGLTLENDGITTVIQKTPEVSVSMVQDDRYCIPVRIRFFANVG